MQKKTFTKGHLHGFLQTYRYSFVNALFHHIVVKRLRRQMAQ